MPSFQDWLRKAFGVRARAGRRKAQLARPPLLATEALEDRTLFATRVWAGLGAGGKATTATTSPPPRPRRSSSWPRTRSRKRPSSGRTSTPSPSTAPARWT